MSARRVAAPLRVSVLGLGLMGTRMAVRLRDAGFDLTVWNRTHAKAAAFAQAGGQASVAIADAVRDAEVVITMLTDGAAVQSALGNEAVLEALPAGSVVIDMSSIAPAEAKAIAMVLSDRGIGFLDAPVSGGVTGAEAGTLSIFVGGPLQHYEHAITVLGVLGRAIHLGEVGAGQVAKLANQIIAGVTIGGVAEGLAFAQAAGIDLSVLIAALTGGYADSRILQVVAPRVLSGDFEARGRTSTHLKDLRNAARFAAANGAAMPYSAVTGALFAEVLERFGDLDHSAIFLALEQRFGASRRP